MGETTLASLWVGTTPNVRLVRIELEVPGSAITLAAGQAETLAEMLLHHARRVRREERRREIADNN